MEFVQGTWLLAVSDEIDPKLLILDTLLPEHDPRSWRILQLPPLSSPVQPYFIFTRHDSSLASCPEFLVDPTQRYFVVLSPDGFALVVPERLLDWCMDFASANGRISWDDWGRDLIAIRLPETVEIQVVDAKLLTHRGWYTFLGTSACQGMIEMYDLSKSAQRDIQVQQVGEKRDGGCRKVLSIPKWSNQFQEGGENPLGALIVGNKVVRYYVSPPICAQS